MFLLLAFCPISLQASTPHNPSNTAQSATQALKIGELSTRIHQIKAMDKTALSSAEKKDLRKEMRSARNEAKKLGNGGIYLSIGALIIIILLLILIL